MEFQKKKKKNQEVFVQESISKHKLIYSGILGFGVPFCMWCLISPPPPKKKTLFFFLGGGSNFL